MTTRHPGPIAAPASIGSRRGLIFSGLTALIVLGAMAMDTAVVRIGSEADTRKQAFSPDTFGATEFPRVQSVIAQKAVAAEILAPAVLADKAVAAAQYGTASSTGTIMMVRLIGVAGTAKAGVYELSVAGLPAEIRLRLQTGPAINGTDLRDAPGDIAFGAFKNQIEYQDAGAGLNRAMKAAVLDGLDTANLSGKTLEVTGAFRLINPKNWLITPSSLAVK